MRLDLKKLRGIVFAAFMVLTFFRMTVPDLGQSGVEQAGLDVLALLTGAGLIVFGFIVLRHKRILENVPPSRIRSVAMGFAEIVGVAQKRTPLSAPYSNIPCVYCRYLCEEETESGRGGRGWATVEQGATPDYFYLRDETGALLVDPDKAETVLERSWRNIERSGGWTGRRRRYTEWWILDGQKLFVAGTVRRLRDAVVERRSVLADRLREIKRDPEKMKLIDADQDGSISEQEWGNAVRAMENVLVREEAAAPQEPPEESIGIGKGSEETTFVIAGRGEKSLLLRLGFEALGGLIGGAAAVVVFAVSLLSHAGLLTGGHVFPW
jgi:E3 ubiquitin ligase